MTSDTKVFAMPNLSVASDYAVLKAGWYEFYYGYEQTVCSDHKGDGCENCEWAFVAKKVDRELMRLAWSELRQTSDQFDVSENLLAGIGIFIAHNVTT